MMRPQVLVVGAGPTGLLLAAELCRRGVDCRLIDSRDAPRHWDRATVVHPRSLEVLEAIGIVDRFLAAGVRQRAVRLHSDGALLGELDLGSCGSAYAFNLGLPEEVTESILTEHLRAQGGEVTRSCRLVGLAQGAGAVRATVEQDGERRELVPGWVVGCDGLHSPTREMSSISFEGHDIPEPWAVFDATLEGWADDFDVTFGYLETTPVILTALPARRWRVYLRPSSATADLIGEAGRVIDRYQPGVSLEDVANPTLFHCHTKVADRYRAGQVLLAGDAAHVCSPAEGHGMNSGLQDAFNLAWKLSLVCQGAAGPALLDSYELERRPVAVSVTESGETAEQIERSADPTVRVERDRRLRAMLADQTARHHEVVAEAELNIGYQHSPIVEGNRDAHPAPGERLPDTAPVRPWGRDPCRLQQLAHDSGHAVLVVSREGGPSDRLARLLHELRDLVAESPLLDRVAALSADPEAPEPFGWLEPAVADQLGVEDVTVVAVRPDGHVGLRSDAVEVAPVRRYLHLLA